MTNTDSILSEADQRLVDDILAALPREMHAVISTADARKHLNVSRDWLTARAAAGEIRASVTGETRGAYGRLARIFVTRDVIARRVLGVSVAKAEAEAVAVEEAVRPAKRGPRKRKGAAR